VKHLCERGRTGGGLAGCGSARRAKSGARRRNAVIYFHDGERVTIVASNAGSPRHPSWYHNLRAHPDVVFGGIAMYATVVDDDTERSRLWRDADRVFPAFASYRRDAAERNVGVALGVGTGELRAVSHLQLETRAARFDRSQVEGGALLRLLLEKRRGALQRFRLDRVDEELGVKGHLDLVADLRLRRDHRHTAKYQRRADLGAVWPGHRAPRAQQEHERCHGHAPDRHQAPPNSLTPNNLTQHFLHRRMRHAERLRHAGVGDLAAHHVDPAAQCGVLAERALQAAAGE
jgi:deazaflavin-dependent oxidoreductase (nitroreductase family)